MPLSHLTPAQLPPYTINYGGLTPPVPVDTSQTWGASGIQSFVRKVWTGIPISASDVGNIPILYTTATANLIGATLVQQFGSSIASGRMLVPPVTIILVSAAHGSPPVSPINVNAIITDAAVLKLLNAHNVLVVSSGADSVDMLAMAFPGTGWQADPKPPLFSSWYRLTYDSTQWLGGTALIVGVASAYDGTTLGNGIRGAYVLRTALHTYSVDGVSATYYGAQAKALGPLFANLRQYLYPQAAMMSPDWALVSGQVTSLWGSMPQARFQTIAPLTAVMDITGTAKANVLSFLQSL